MTPSFQRTILRLTPTELITRFDRICHNIVFLHLYTSRSIRVINDKHVPDGFPLHFFRTLPSSSYCKAIWSQAARPNSSSSLPPRCFASSFSSVDFIFGIAVIIIFIALCRMLRSLLASSGPFLHRLTWPYRGRSCDTRHPTG